MRFAASGARYESLLDALRQTIYGAG
jgi:hypothetical protein